MGGSTPCPGCSVSSSSSHCGQDSWPLCKLPSVQTQHSKHSWMKCPRGSGRVMESLLLSPNPCSISLSLMSLAPSSGNQTLTPSPRPTHVRLCSILTTQRCAIVNRYGTIAPCTLHPCSGTFHGMCVYVVERSASVYAAITSLHTF